MANVILDDVAKRRGVRELFVIDSSGVSSEEHGNPMDYRARKVFEMNGYDLSNPLIAKHHAKKISSQDAQNFDFFFPMTKQHARALAQNFDIPREKIFLWRWFEDRSQDHFSGAEDLSDPWYGDLDDFEIAYGQLVQSAEEIIDFALEQAQEA
jgi:protein-tyrosine phosphatase